MHSENEAVQVRLIQNFDAIIRQLTYLQGRLTLCNCENDFFLICVRTVFLSMMLNDPVFRITITFLMSPGKHLTFHTSIITVATSKKRAFLFLLSKQNFEFLNKNNKTCLTKHHCNYNCVRAKKLKRWYNCSKSAKITDHIIECTF